MAKTKSKQERRRRVHQGIRKKIHGTPVRPRLSVYRSNKYTYAQLIDDIAGHTIAAASSLEEDASGEEPMEESHAVGRLLAERAQEAGITKAVFDRSGYRYHGRVRAVAEGAREGGLSL
jgi:large subunit ribosomal protein L18